MTSTGSSFSAPPFQGIATFGRCPQTQELADVDVTILGVPFDSTVSYRSGTRFGPRAIREQSLLLWGYNNALGVAPFEKLKVIDFGDVDVIPVDVSATHRAIESTAKAIIDAGSRLVTLGGEHSISLPLLRAHAAVHGPMAVVHFDAHPDTWDEEYSGYKFSHGTPFRRAIEEGLIDTSAYFQIGIRGPTAGPQDYEDARQLGAQMVVADEVHSRGVPSILTELRHCLGSKPTYVTLDIDAVDPAFAPGTGTPEVGGLTSHQILQLVRGMRDQNLVGFDLVEVSPPYDPSQITAILGSNLVFEFLSLLALKKRSINPA